MSRDLNLLMAQWDGEAFAPLRRHQRKCDEQFVVGERYMIEVREARSWVSHRHQFAWLHEAWQNLPEHIAERFPSETHLRRFALIKTGFADSRQIVASSKAEALRIAAFVRPLDEYAVVTVDGPVVTVWTAQSQSMKAMGRERFQASKQAILDYIASLIEVDPKALEKAA